MHVYIYIHTYIDVYVYTLVYEKIRTSLSIYIYSCIYTHTPFMYVNLCICGYKIECIDIYIYRKR